MNKSDLVKNIFRKTHYLDKKDIEEALDKTIEYMSLSLEKNKRIELRGFGTFSTRKRPTRMGRNPRTSESIIIHSKFYPYFRASKSLKSNINK